MYLGKRPTKVEIKQDMVQTTYFVILRIRNTFNLLVVLPF